MISQVYTGIRNVFSSFTFSGPARGNNALATIKDLQNVIWGINNQIRFRPIDFILSKNGANDPIFKYVMSGAGSAAECQGSCNCSSSQCPCNGPVSDPGACTKDAIVIFNPPVRTGVGVYDVVFNSLHPDLVNRGMGVWVSQLADLTHRVTVSKFAQNKITISTYISGVPSDDVLDETVFQMKLYVINK